MFNNIGNKIKVWAKIEFLISFFGSVLLFLIGSLTVISSKSPAINVLWLFISAIGGMVSGLITSYYIYGFGTLVAARTSTKRKLNADGVFKPYSVSLGRVLACLGLIASAIVLVVVFANRSKLFFGSWTTLKLGQKMAATLLDFIAPLVSSSLVVIYCVLFFKGNNYSELLSASAIALFFTKIYDIVVKNNMVQGAELTWIAALMVFACGSLGLFKDKFKPITIIAGAITGVFATVSVFTGDSVLNELAVIPAPLILISFVGTSYKITSE